MIRKTTIFSAFCDVCDSWKEVRHENSIKDFRRECEDGGWIVKGYSCWCCSDCYDKREVKTNP